MKIYKIFPISIIVTILFIGGCKSTVKQTEVKTGQYEQSLEKEIKTTINVHYMLYIPEEYSTSEKEWPLILFLHGAGERGDDLSKVLVHGPPKLIAKENKKFPFVIISPQCPERDSWSSKMQIATLNALLDEIVLKYRIDQKRIYVTGLSMGGSGTWNLAAAYPNRFAAIAPICGRGNPEDAEKIAHLPIWVFHGAKDQTVPIERSEEMVEALKKAGSQVRFTVYPEATHDSWTITYENPELYDWFLQHTNSRIE